MSTDKFDLVLARADRVMRQIDERDGAVREAANRERDRLFGRFGRVLPFEEANMYFGGVNAVRLTTEGRFEAAADPRRSGGVSFA